MNAATQLMNNATQSMMRAAWASTALVGIGTVLLIATLALTWMANRAAQEAVRVTREMGRDQTRAYVEVEGVNFYWGSPRGEHPAFKILLKNHGATPAKWFQIRQAFRLAALKNGNELPVPEQLDDLFISVEFGPVYNGVNPNQDAKSIAGPLIPHWQMMQNCRREQPSVPAPPNNTHGVIVFGEVRYCTIFDEIVVSQFAFGAASFEGYKAESFAKTGRTTDGLATYGTSFEKPQNLSRLPISLRLYKPEKQD